MRIILLIPVLLINVFNISAQIEVGKKAPLISVDEWVDNPHFDFQKIEGKVIVLDFWFTHCAPCVYTIPHLNDLSEKFKNDSIDFIAITFEDKNEVEKFLSKKKMLSNIGSDTSYTTINAYEIEGYPTTFLIDKNGFLRWKGYPSHLNPKLIDALLDKKYYPQVIKDNSISVAKSNNDIKEIFTYPITVVKNDYMDGASGMQSNLRELSMVNQPLDKVMAFLLQKSQSRISTSDTNKYDIRFKIPDDLPRNNVRETIIKSLLNELSLTIKSNAKRVHGFELVMTNNRLFVNNAINPDKIYYGMGTSTDQTHWKGDGAQMSDLVMELENRFGVYINNKTNLFGFFEFKFPTATFDQARNYLLNTYGLELVPTMASVEITEIINKHKKH